MRNPLILFVAGATKARPKIPLEAGMLVEDPALRCKRGDLPALRTGRSNHFFNKCSAFLGLYLIFTLHRGRSVIEFFMVNELPGTISFCVFSSALVVALNPRIKILSGSDIITSVLLALEDVNVIGHGIVLRLEHLPVK